MPAICLGHFYFVKILRYRVFPERRSAAPRAPAVSATAATHHEAQRAEAAQQQRIGLWLGHGRRGHREREGVKGVVRVGDRERDVEQRAGDIG